jgi:hypothetical protein
MRSSLTPSAQLSRESTQAVIDPLPLEHHGKVAEVLASSFLYSCREKSPNCAPRLTLFRVRACISSKPSRTGRLVAASRSSLCISQRRPRPPFAPGAVSTPQRGSIRVMVVQSGYVSFDGYPPVHTLCGLAYLSMAAYKCGLLA